MKNFSCLLSKIIFDLIQKLIFYQRSLVMKKTGLFAIIILSAVSLFADQAAWITKEQAEKGAKLIKTSGEIRHYCAPCGDNFYRAEKVKTSVAVKAGMSDSKSQYYEVKVNGVEVDLAYVYVRTGGKWTNAAMLLNIEVTDVPKVLPDDLPDEEASAEDIPSGSEMHDFESGDEPFEDGD